MAPVDAMSFTLERIRKGQDTISVTGNVLRDYLTDCSRSWSWAQRQDALDRPADRRRRHVRDGRRRFRAQARAAAGRGEHLRWDTLGEFLALAASFEHLARPATRDAQMLADTLDRATGTFLNENKSPARKVGELDNRGSHFYLALYWAEELARQTDDAELAAAFSGWPSAAGQQQSITAELLAVQGAPGRLGGYYLRIRPRRRP